MRRQLCLRHRRAEDAAEEVKRLAESMGWKAGTVCGQGAGDGAVFSDKVGIFDFQGSLTARLL